MTTQPVNTALLLALRAKDHPLLAMHPDDVNLPHDAGDVLIEARSAHHLLDMIGVPQGDGLDTNLDARTWRAAMRLLQLSERLSQITQLHHPRSDPLRGGMDRCVACDLRWPCKTYAMATGTYEEANERAPV